MPLDNPRIEELRRRVQADPSSIAFAQLAEEYRRAGSYDDAVQACRLGLARHPGYLSARVTLGRALVELEALDEAQQELEFVLRAAPENLAAIRGMAEIHHRRGHMAEALEYYHRALEFARHDPELEETVAQIARELGGGQAGESAGLSFEEARSELISAIGGVPAPSATGPTPVAPDEAPTPRTSSYTAASDSAVYTSGSVVDALAGTARDVLTDPSSETVESVVEPSVEDLLGALAPAADGATTPFDFDALLGALGEAPDRPAPSPVEALLTAPSAGPDGVVSRPDPVMADDALAAALAEAESHPDSGTAGDPLADLEASLRSHVPSIPEAAAEEETLSPVQKAIVDDLERWLDELVVQRDSPPERT